MLLSSYFILINNYKLLIIRATHLFNCKKISPITREIITNIFSNFTLVLHNQNIFLEIVLAFLFL